MMPFRTSCVKMKGLLKQVLCLLIPEVMYDLGSKMRCSPCKSFLAITGFSLLDQPAEELRADATVFSWLSEKVCWLLLSVAVCMCQCMHGLLLIPFET